MFLHRWLYTNALKGESLPSCSLILMKMYVKTFAHWWRHIFFFYSCVWFFFYSEWLFICQKTNMNLMCFVDQKDESFYTVTWACHVDGTPFVVAGGLNGILRVIDAGGEKIHKVSCLPSLTFFILFWVVVVEQKQC